MQEENEVVRGLLATQRDAIVEGWLAEVAGASSGTRAAALAVTKEEAKEIVSGLELGLSAGGTADSFNQPLWEDLRGILARLSGAGAERGDSAGETSRLVLSLKRPLFELLQKALASDARQLIVALWATSSLVDKMAEHTVTVYQQARDAIIRRQQQELLELSTPVVKLWEGVLAVPMIGALDSSRTQLIMESLLQRIVETGSELAIMDITGVPTVDTLVAQHLLKTVAAIRLMGADCIISGVRPQIAQTIVHLGIDLQGITTKASLADALALALKRQGYVVTRSK